MVVGAASVGYTGYSPPPVTLAVTVAVGVGSSSPPVTLAVTVAVGVGSWSVSLAEAEAEGLALVAKVEEGATEEGVAVGVDEEVEDVVVGQRSAVPSILLTTHDEASSVYSSK